MTIRAGIRAGIEWHDIVVPQVRGFREFRHVGADRKVGAIDPAKLFRIGMDMDQNLTRMVRGDKGIAVGRSLAHARANHQHQVGIPDPLDQFGIGSIAQVSGPYLA